MKGWIVALIFILVVAWILNSAGNDQNKKGFDPPFKTEAPGFTCPVPGTC